MAITIKRRGIETPKIKPKFVEVFEELTPFIVVVVPIIGEPPTKTPAVASVFMLALTAVAYYAESNEAVPSTIVDPWVNLEIINLLKLKFGLCFLQIPDIKSARADEIVGQPPKFISIFIWNPTLISPLHFLPYKVNLVLQDIQTVAF